MFTAINKILYNLYCLLGVNMSKTFVAFNNKNNINMTLSSKQKTAISGAASVENCQLT